VTNVNYVANVYHIMVLLPLVICTARYKHESTCLEHLLLSLNHVKAYMANVLNTVKHL